MAFVLVAVGVLAYLLVSRAAMLKAAAEQLNAELKQFKEGGFDQLIAEKLALLTNKAMQELESREKAIRQVQQDLLEEGKKATAAAEKFKQDFGAVTTEIHSLQELQGKVGELNDLLKPQQLRGELGEVIVRNLLADKLPRQYEEDYAFSDGKRVEFVVRINDRLIPVDSKLQLEDFKRLREAEEPQRQAYRAEFKRKVKQKIDEVKAYIRPEEGTMNFALMFIPSEAVFYELIANKDFLEGGGLYEYAQEQRVFLTSPLTFWVYLTTIAQGLKGLEIERRAEDVLSALQALAAEIRNFSQDEFRKVGVHLRNATAQYDEAERTLRTVEQGLGTLERVESSPAQQEGATR
ncbi:MAG: DNA recombination protein RmuC [Candidatus Omnitrophica bacterium]|nr:DNA recombination protein RmuC [Candidatus Omnitrophota bacterium]